MKNEFYGINIASIKTLEEKLVSILNKYILENGDINIYAILHKNMQKYQNLNLHNLDKFILNEYPNIDHGSNILHFDLEASYLNITDDKIILDYTSYLKSELSNLIFNHNKNLLIPSSKDFLEEKEKIVDWHSYNTPIMNDPEITPLRGTSLERGFFSSGSQPQNTYNNWITTSVYLLSEYNIWKKALDYAGDENKNYDSNSIEFKAYNYIILRQFNINQTNSDSFDPKGPWKNFYIRDFTLKDVISRELYEDMLYILLNLLLANKIIGNIRYLNEY